MTGTIGQQPDTKQRVVTVIAEQAAIDPSEVTPDKGLIADLQLDSLDIVELATELEDVFDLQIPDDAVDTLVTVSDVQDYVEAHARASLKPPA